MQIYKENVKENREKNIKELLEDKIYHWVLQKTKREMFGRPLKRRNIYNRHNLYSFLEN